MRKTFIQILTTIALSLISATGIVVYASEGRELTSENHPRLIFDDEGFNTIRSLVATGENEAVAIMHDMLMKMADACLKDTSVIRVRMDASNKRLLITSTITKRMVSVSWAYKMTGERKYLEYVENNLATISSLENWNPNHFLDVGEISTAVALAYDWLYNDLKESTRKMTLRALKEYALEISRSDNKDYTWWYSKKHNWNQVCNSGLVSAALAVYESCPELAQEVLDDAVRTNRQTVEYSYGPDGAYPEGPGYWMYGTAYQIQILTLMESVLGTDYGISSSKGFLKTGEYRIFSRGNTGHTFNFADTGVDGVGFYSPLWYFAVKSNTPDIVYDQLECLRKESERITWQWQYLPAAIYWASKMDIRSIKPYEGKFYAAQGRVPMMICRTGWEKNDSYLAIKGGKATVNHAHMDGGSFVYDADGVRWAMDYYRQPYQDFETEFHKIGAKLFDMRQDSFRWKIFRMNNRQHNTLTVNDEDHNVFGQVKMTSAEVLQDRMEATFDMTPLFNGNLLKAERKAALLSDGSLLITDELHTPEDRPAHIRWTMVSEGKPRITKDGIILRKNGKKRILKVHGAEVEYRIWSSDPRDYDSPINHLDADNKGTYICGYEVDLHKSTQHTISITLIKN